MIRPVIPELADRCYLKYNHIRVNNLALNMIREKGTYVCPYVRIARIMSI